VIGRLDRALRRRLVEVLRPHGLTVTEYTTLSVLRFRRGLSNAQLARRAFVTPQAMSEVIAALEGEGLVRRQADPDHGRILRAELTEKGTARLAASDAAVQEIEEQMLAELAECDRERLLADLTSCVRLLGTGAGDA
jgi:DNA-binding MarR family transcriptional regulator